MSAFSKSKGDISAEFSKTIGQSLSGLKTVGTLFAAALAPGVLQGVAQLATQAGGVLVAILGNIGTAAGGAGVAFAGLAAAALPAFVLLKQALTQQDAQLTTFQAKISALAKPWQNVVAAVQKGFLPALVESLKTVNQLIPAFTAYGAAIGSIAGNYAKLIAQTATSAQNQQSLLTILNGSKQVLSTLGAVINIALTPLLTILAAAQPIVEKLSAAFVSMAQHFADFIAQKAAAGELTTTFDTWYTRLTVIGGILGNLGKILVDVFGGGASSVDGLLTSFKKLTDQWAAFTSSTAGKNQIKDFFSNALTGVEGFITTLRTKVLPPLQELYDTLTIKNAGPLLSNLGNALLTLIDAVAKSDSLSAFIQGLTFALQGFATVVSLPGVSQGIVILGTIVGATKGLKVVANIFAPLTEGLGALFIVLGLPGASVAETFFPELAAGLAPLAAVIAPLTPVLAALALTVAAFIAAWVFWPQIEKFLQDAPGLFNGLSTPMKVLVATLGALVALSPFGAIAAGIIGLVAAIKNFGTVKDTLLGVGKDIVNFFTGLPALLSQIPGVIVGFFTNLPAKITAAAQKLIPAMASWIEDVAPKIAAGLGTITGTIVGFFLSLPIKLIALGIQLTTAFLSWIVNLPAAIASVLPTVVTTIVNIFQQLPNIISTIATTLVRVFITILSTLPGLALTALSLLGTFLFNAIQAAAPQLVSSVGNLLTQAVNFFQRLPGLAAAAISGLGALLGSVVTGASAVVTGLIGGMISSVVSFLSGLPGRAASAISSLGSALAGVVTSAVGTVLGAVGSLISQVLSSIGTIVGRIPGALAGIGGALTGALRSAFTSAWNSMVNSLPSFHVDLPFGVGHFDFSFGFLRLAQGLIVDSPTFAMIGEAGREAVIPLTQPARAMQLMNESGLTQLALNQNVTPLMGARPLLQIGEANFNTKVDLDMLAARIMIAYRAEAAHARVTP